MAQMSALAAAQFADGKPQMLAEQAPFQRPTAAPHSLLPERRPDLRFGDLADRRDSHDPVSTESTALILLPLETHAPRVDVERWILAWSWTLAPTRISGAERDRLADEYVAVNQIDTALPNLLRHLVTRAVPNSAR